MVLLASLSIPGLYMTMTGESKSLLVEKRERAEIPSFPTTYDSLVNFPAAFEEYYNNSFGFRDRLTIGYALLQFELFSRSSNRKVVVGRDDYLFFEKSVKYDE
jgi:hypothetical protein